MHLPSPDAAMVAAADRLAALPQRRGVPLPAVMAPMHFLEPAGMVLTGVSIVAACLKIGVTPANAPVLGFAFLFCLNGVTSGIAARSAARRRARDAAAWSATLAATYRAEAIAMRDDAWLAVLRVLCLSLAVALGAFACWVAARVPSAVLALPLFAAAASSFGRVADSYAACAMPASPAARRPTFAALP